MGDLVFDDPHWDRVYKLLNNDKYAGNQVMIVGEKVVAYGKSVDDFKDVIKQHKGKLCTLMYVPSKDDPKLMLI